MRLNHSVLFFVNIIITKTGKKKRHPVLRLVAKQFAKAEAEYGPDAEHMHVISMYEAAAGGAEIRAEVGV